MTYVVSFSNIFKEQLAHIVDLDTIINSKKIIQNAKPITKELEKMQKRGVTMQTTRIRSPVVGTNYVVIYRVVNNPKYKLIAKKIIRCK